MLPSFMRRLIVHVHFMGLRDIKPEFCHEASFLLTDRLTDLTVNVAIARLEWGWKDSGTKGGRKGRDWGKG